MEFIMKEINLKVNGMHCEGCENRIKNSLSTIDGIDEVTANHIYGTVVIKINKNVDLEKAKETIEDLGFEIEEN